MAIATQTASVFQTYVDSVLVMQPQFAGQLPTPSTTCSEESEASQSLSGMSTPRSSQSPGGMISSSIGINNGFGARIMNTFIHIDDVDDAVLLPKRSHSMPDLCQMIKSRASAAKSSEPLSVAPSVGSQMHGAGLCRPCAWLWKVDGCKNGKDCRHCHSCPQSEIKRRRAVRLSAKRAEKQQREVQQERGVLACP